MRGEGQGQKKKKTGSMRLQVLLESKTVERIDVIYDKEQKNAVMGSNPYG